MNVARNEPTIPSTTVKTKPLGLFGPGERKRAMMPATKPTTMIQMTPDIDTSAGRAMHHHTTALDGEASRTRSGTATIARDALLLGVITPSNAIASSRVGNP